MTVKKPVKEQRKDTGIVLGLAILYCGIILSSAFWLKISLITILIAMILPNIFYYPAILWFGFSEKLGKYVSMIILGIVYVLIVMPVGKIRKIMKKDVMMLNEFKKGKQSSWIIREHKYSENDLQKPY